MCRKCDDDVDDADYRIENLFVNQFMHMFQSSWRDLCDFEGIFMRIKNTISGQPTHFSNREYIIST